MRQLSAILTEVFGVTASTIRPLHGGNVGQVYRVVLADGRQCVAKIGTDNARLDLEGAMLRYLDEHSDLPVPTVLYSSGSVLLLTFIEGVSLFSKQAEENAADLLAHLHSITTSQFGFDDDTLIGGLRQPNSFTANWLAFFREQRLLYMAAEAERVGNLTAVIRGRIEAFAAKLGDFLAPPTQPALLHGDVWTTNVLARGDRIAAFLDPAIYYGHPEIELAFITLFNTFGEAFFARYSEHHPIQPGFFSERRAIYNLYPLLVHVRLFGGQYVRAVDQTLRQFGA